MATPSAPPSYDVAMNEEKKHDPQVGNPGYQSAPGNPPYPAPGNPPYPAYPQNPQAQPYYNQAPPQGPYPVPPGGKCL